MSTTHVGAAFNAPTGITPLERLLLVRRAEHADIHDWPLTALGRLAVSANVSSSTATRSPLRLGPDPVERLHRGDKRAADGSREAQA
ncbi:hypothetical protein ACIP93_33490 [Streptomyces sp. NPDC088745]|uniref:hypothetical protein n=1 Tax=Streptomyces sp. NPDC088745 TaxID=3365884 RepID=UPI00380600BA